MGMKEWRKEKRRRTEMRKEKIEGREVMEKREASRKKRRATAAMEEESLRIMMERSPKEREGG